MSKNHWIKEKKLSEGGQGVTYIVVGKKIGEKAVMKQIKKAHDAKAIARFSGEVAVLEAISSLNISVPKLIDHNLFDADDPEEPAYICMDYIPGPTLTKFLKKAPLPENDAIELLVPLLQTVSVLHANGLLHRDIKPGNIIVRKGSSGLRLVLVDFGLAYGREVQAELTGPLENVGNKFLMLPETHYPAGPKHDARSDICQLVGILFFVVTGTFPMHLGRSRFEAPHKRADLPSGKLSPELEMVFDKGFSFEVENRFQSASELITALEGIRKKRSIHSADFGQKYDVFNLANATFFYRRLLRAYEEQSLLGIRDEFIAWMFQKVEAYTLFRTTIQSFRQLQKFRDITLESEAEIRQELLEELSKMSDVDVKLKSEFIFSEAEAHFYSRTFGVECERELICSENKENCITADGPVFSCFRSHPGARNAYHFERVIDRLDQSAGPIPPRIFRLDTELKQAVCWRCGDL